MKANEVRLGNLVKYKDKIYKIIGMDYDLPVLDSDEFGIGVVGWDNLQGVELNNQLLLKCGFKTQEFHWANCIKLRVCNDYSYLYWWEEAGLELSVAKHCLKNSNIKYLHQLQNLYFALTGEELNINQIIK